MESMSVHSEVVGASGAVRKLHYLEECIITAITWDEAAMRLRVTLDYIWTDDGAICFTKGIEPRELVLTFELTTVLILNNALTPAMIAEPHRLNWGIGEIARFELLDASDFAPDGFLAGRFLWESDRRIDVAFKRLGLLLSDVPSSR